MKGYVDLHSHYVPMVDDGVRSLEDGLALLRGLHSIGFDEVVATPHIRTAMYENRKPGLTASFEAMQAQLANESDLPAIGLGAEHFYDDVFRALFESGESVPYPGGKAALVELPSQVLPQRLEHFFFTMSVRGVRPVLAHPERYSPLFKKTAPLDAVLTGGTLALLDVMSLVGKYGNAPQRAAERMLEEGVYYAACSDAHKPSDVEHVAAGIDRLARLVGKDEAHELLSDHPKRVLQGTVDL